MKYAKHITDPDVILIGSGIMSANLGALLKRLEPALTIQVYEVTEELAQESSHGWNNAGTGHAGICELSYTPKLEADGTVNVSKAIGIFEQFEQSKQFWSYAVASGMAENPNEFINPLAHLSFVHGPVQVDFLKARHAAMSAHHFFSDMVYTTDPATIGNWAPLLLEGRGAGPIAATKMDSGTDVNFGNIARKLLGWLAQQPGCGIASGHRVVDLKKHAGVWDVAVKDLATGAIRHNHAKFVFVGAGGGSLHLLQKSGIPDGKGLGGFPIGGQWLVCDNPEIVQKQHAKIYGQSSTPLPRWPCRISTRASSTEKRPCSSVPSPRGRPSSSTRRAAGPTCPAPSSRTTSSPCSRSVPATCRSSATSSSRARKAWPTAWSCCTFSIRRRRPRTGS